MTATREYDNVCGKMCLTGRNPAKVRILAGNMGCRPLPVEAMEQERFDLLIHATSVGMWPHSEECFLRPEQVHADVVFDLIYNPVETRLLRMAPPLLFPPTPPF